MRAIACVAAGIVLCSTAGYAQSLVSKEIVLADWGMSGISEIGFIAAGVLHHQGEDRLVVHDMRREKPHIPIPAGGQGRPPPSDGPLFVVAHFDRGNTNRLNGHFNAFARLPSSAALGIAGTPDGGAALHFSYKNIPPGFAGFWIHLYNFRDPATARAYCDATAFRLIGFRIRGAQGGEPVVLQVADRKWATREESLPVGDVGAFLPRGKITTEWQVAWIPLAQLPAGIDRSELASLVFRIPSDHAGKIFLKDLVLAREQAEIPAAAHQIIAPAPLHNAMWLWETNTLYGRADEQHLLAQFCRRHAIRSLFIQIPYEASQSGATWQVTWDTAAMQQLVSRLRQEGIAVYALDGDPHFALAPQHGRVLALIRSIIAYNANAGPTARIVGVRYDNEPYLLPHFGGHQQATILRQYVDLLAKAQKAAAAGDLSFGVDIPFWFDARNEYGELVAGLDGRPVIEAIIDTVDDIGIMDYRTVAYGADGVIAHGSHELAYASRRGKKVFVGLETVWLPDETLLEFGRGDAGGTGALAVEDLGNGTVRIHLRPGAVTGSATFFQTRSITVPSSKISFFAKTPRDLAEVMDAAAREFAGEPSFAGFAIHSYESYRPWVERQGK